MEHTAPFDLALVRRDWLVGSGQAAFHAGFDHWHARCRAWAATKGGDSAVSTVGEEGRASYFLRAGARGFSGLVVCERDPVAFAAVFLGAAAAGLSLALANPRWGEVEWAQFDRLLAVAVAPPAAVCIPTGGTTGGVKLAVHTWSSLAAAVDGLQEYLGGGPIHSCCLLPLHHVSGLMPVLRSLLTGGRVRFDEAATSGYCLSLVPTQLRRALADPEAVARLRSARVVFVGGAAMPSGLAGEVRRLRLPVVPVYGMTETAAMVAAIPNDRFLEDPEAGAVAIGKNRFLLEADGQIRIQGPSLFQGYLGQDPMDLSTGYVTGDIGWLDAAGGLHLIGRRDGLIVTGGEKVDPREVESVLRSLDGIDSARIVGEASEEWGQVIVAYVRQRDGRIDVARIRALLKAELAAYKVPKKILPEPGG